MAISGYLWPGGQQLEGIVASLQRIHFLVHQNLPQFCFLESHLLAFEIPSRDLGCVHHSPEGVMFFIPLNTQHPRNEYLLKKHFKNEKTGA